MSFKVCIFFKHSVKYNVKAKKQGKKLWSGGKTVLLKSELNNSDLKQHYVTLTVTRVFEKRD